MKPQKILVLVADPKNREQPAIRRGFSMARGFGASLHVHGTAFNAPLASQASLSEGERQRMVTILVEKRLDEVQMLAETIAERGIGCSYSASWDYPMHESLARMVAEGGYDFVLFDSFGRAMGTRQNRPALLSQTDWQVMVNCPSPCLLVRMSGANAYNSVLAAVDPTHASDKAAALDSEIIEFGKQVSGNYGASLRVVHAFHSLTNTPKDFSEEEELPVDHADRLLADSIREDLARITLEHDLDPETVLLHRGAASEVILRTVKEVAADLVVMGAVSRGRVHDWVIGSVAERVIGDLDCDLLIIKPDGFKPRFGKPPKYHVLLQGYRAARKAANSG